MVPVNQTFVSSGGEIHISVQDQGKIQTQPKFQDNESLLYNLLHAVIRFFHLQFRNQFIFAFL